MQHRGKKYYHLTGEWKSHSEGDCELCNKVATLQKEEGDQSEKEKQLEVDQVMLKVITGLRGW